MPQFKSDLQNCIATLQKGGTILYPTDTIWGLGCDALNDSAVKKIFTIKNRPSKKSLIVLVASVEMARKFVSPSNEILINYLIQQEVPTTGIFTGAQNLPDSLINEDGTIAIRITKDVFCKDLIIGFGHPIVTTSANLSGNTAAAIFTEIDPIIKNAVDYIVHYRQDDYQKAAPSHIVRAGKDNELIFIR